MDSRTDGVETDEADRQIVTGDSERLDGVGVSSTEEGTEGGTVKSPLSLGHESLGQVDGMENML
jgi:hypothetical protein